MDEKRAASLRRFFSVSAVVFFLVYLGLMALSLFSFPLSQAAMGCLVFGTFLLVLMKNVVETKAEELGGVESFRLVSLTAFTILFDLCYCVMIYWLRIKPVEDALWAVIALLASMLVDTSLCALRRLNAST